MHCGLWLIHYGGSVKSHYTRLLLGCVRATHFVCAGSMKLPLYACFLLADRLRSSYGGSMEKRPMVLTIIRGHLCSWPRCYGACPYRRTSALEDTPHMSLHIDSICLVMVITS